jgi:hypothetical protein
MQNVEIKSPHTTQNTCSESGIINHGVHKIWYLAPYFPICINDLPAITLSIQPILFADDTSIIIAHPELILKNIIDDVFST